MHTEAELETPRAIARLLEHPLTLFVARVWVTAPFLAGGVMKLFNWSGGEAEMASVGLHPAWAFNLAVFCTELGGSLLIIMNRKVWLGAGALGVFTVLSTFLAHRFWDFAGAAREAELNSFLEHWTISAAFILVTVVSLLQRRTS